jgi:hypothetical protein
MVITSIFIFRARKKSRAPVQAADRVTGAKSQAINQPRSSGILQIIDHVFGQVFVFANYKVHMVGHDGAGVAGVCEFVERIAYRFADQSNLIGAKPDGINNRRSSARW